LPLLAQDLIDSELIEAIIEATASAKAGCSRVYGDQTDEPSR
jgi:hypothetical protein